MEGWIKLYRGIQDHWIFDNPDYLKAWITIILTVNHEDRKVVVRGELLECNRGQSLLSLTNWAKLFGKKWSIQRLRTFFELLKHDSMINSEGLKYTTRLTVCNYDTYQDSQQADNILPTFEQHSENILLTTNKNDKNDKNERSKERDDFLTKIIRAFQDSYFDVFQNEYVIMGIGKERSAASKLVKSYKTKYPDSTSDETIHELRDYFISCCEIQDDWLRKNMSLPIIVSKFNEINNTIKNGKQKIKSVSSRSDELRAAINAVYDAKGMQ